jgi:hypothetical protein
MMITDEKIKEAKATTSYSLEPHHMKDDCIRAAYHWLDAQPKLRGLTTKPLTIKHIIERWAGFYVSLTDVEVAAHMHPDIYGYYPFYNIHCNFVHPLDCRLVGLVHHRYNLPTRKYDNKTYFMRQINHRNAVIRSL